jgi:short-subunit dehydrogenase
MPDPLQPLTDDARWALVTGASAGIGREFCIQLAALGYNLVMVARRADRMHALASELQSRHGTASLVLPADLARPESCRGIAAELRKRDIFVEFLVNNAGYGVAGRFTDERWKVHRDFLQVMTTAVCELCWLLLPDMQQRDRGYVVNVASVAGLLPGTEGHTLYGASKALLIQFSQSLGAEHRGSNVRVSALCPGFTYSEFHDVSGTRELVSELPGYMWLQTDDVVRYGIESVMRENPRIVAIPGRFYQVLVWLSGALPWLARLMTRRMARKFRKLD